MQKDSYILRKFTIAIKYIIVLNLGVSGISKILVPFPTIQALQETPNFPEFLILPAVSTLPVIEIVIALGLIFNYFVKHTIFICSTLFFGFFAFSIYGIIIGMSSDCGCFGSLFKSKIGWKMSLRNFMFLAMTGWLLYYHKIKVAQAK